MTTLRSLVGLCTLLGLCVACSASQQTGTSDADAPSGPEQTVVARYADTDITQAELDSAFAASVGGREQAADTSLSAYRDFLDQYLNYRLKVRAAHDAGVDTLPSIQRDVQRYRLELARPQLMRDEVYEPVARTLYERRRQAVDVSHILIRTSQNQDTTTAYRTIQTIADSLDRGVPFAELALRNSEDPSARKQGSRGYRGRLGYLRAGQIVEPFERRMYALEPGATSDVFRTQYGYHIVKVHDKRPAQPPVRLSHILRRGRGSTAAPQQFLDSLRTEIQTGTLTFAAAAKKHSQDPQSASKGGALGTVNLQSLPSSLRSAVTSLDSVGTISEPVQSRFGYHLLKLTGRQERKSFDEAYDALKKKISGQPRVEQRKRTVAYRVRSEEGVTVDTTRLLTATGIASTDSLARPLLSLPDSSAVTSRTVATLGDSTYTVGQMARHLMQTDGGARTTVAQLIESFLNENAIEYAAVKRSLNDPSLAQEIRKYREGTLLFRYMQDSVWTAAAQDSAGLRATYQKNQDQYRFPERIRTIVLRTPADSLLQPLKTRYQADGSPGALVAAADADTLVSVDTVFVTDRSPEVYQPVRSADDLELLGPTSQDDEWLLMIRDTRLPPRAKTFAEARSSVVQDYQQTYEQRVIRRLRTRYDADTYPERLRPPFETQPPGQQSPRNEARGNTN